MEKFRQLSNLGSDRRAFEVHLGQCLLVIQRHIQYDRPPRHFFWQDGSCLVCAEQRFRAS